MTDFTNSKRAACADAALAVYTNEKGIHGEDLETRITDLMIDLHHLARLNKLPFDAIRARAGRMHREELVEDPD